MRGRTVLWGAILVASSVLAGCTDQGDPPATAPTKSSVGGGSPTSSGSPSTTSPSPAPMRGTNERWHFHDYWQNDPTITLYEGDVTFNVTPMGGDGLPTLNAIVDLPHGTIVPPETGFLTLTVDWEGAAAPAGGLVNVTYKPADSNAFFWAGDALAGVPLVINTTESNCDVPHRQASAWRFNLTAAPGGAEAPGLPPQTFHFNITATIGRPLFIDPPHLNWWRAGDTIPLVAAASGKIHSATTPAANLTVPDPSSVPSPSAPGVPSIPPERPAPPVKAEDFQTTYRVPMDSGRIVPEGTKTVLAMLNWTTQVPDAKLSLHYRENNLPSAGQMELLSESPGARIYVLKPSPPQTDTTYSNRTTWEFTVVPEGAPVAAFDGEFTLVAWASRLEPAAVLAEITAA